jgi:tetratricopeptide (TPR) repeat protein
MNNRPLHTQLNSHSTSRAPLQSRRLLRLMALALAWPLLASAGPVDDAVADVQRDWEVIRYQTPVAERVKKLEALSLKAHEVTLAHAGRSEPLVWEGIVLSSLAGENGGLGALGLVKQAKGMYEQAIQIDGQVLDGSAYGSLGVLYYKVPGWPIGFGDKARADDMLRRALAISPQGVDANFFYGEFLVETKKEPEAVAYLERAMAAPPRPGRQVADAGRKEEARALLARIKAN